MIMTHGDRIDFISRTVPAFSVPSEVEALGAYWLGTFEIVRPSSNYREKFDAYTTYSVTRFKSFRVIVKWQDGNDMSYETDRTCNDETGSHGVLFVTRFWLVDYLMADTWWTIVNR